MRTVVVSKAAVMHEGNILLIKRSETDVRRPLDWDLPGGWVEEGEDVATAVVREIAEETGLKVAESAVQLVYTHTAIVKDNNVNWLFYIANSTSTDVELSNEHVEYEWVDLQTALQEITYDVQKDFITHIVANRLV